MVRCLGASADSGGRRFGLRNPERSTGSRCAYASRHPRYPGVIPCYPGYKTFDRAQGGPGPSLLLLSLGFRKTRYPELLAPVRGECTALEEALVLDTQWDTLLADASLVDDQSLAARESTLTFDDPINIQYTSGTTGTPKGATLSHHNLLNNGFFCGEVLGYSERDRVCIPVPFYHCFGMVIGNLACTSHGACIVVPGEAFDPGDTLATVQEERCTSLYGVPTMFIGELNHPDFAQTDCSSLRTGVMGRGALPRRGHATGSGSYAHDRDHDLLRHDRDVASLGPDPHG